MRTRTCAQPPPTSSPRRRLRSAQVRTDRQDIEGHSAAFLFCLDWRSRFSGQLLDLNWFIHRDHAGVTSGAVGESVEMLISL